MRKITTAAMLTALVLSLASNDARGFKIPGKKAPKPPVDYTELISIQ